MTETREQPGTDVERRKVDLSGPILDFDQAYRLAKNLCMAELMPRDLRGKPQDVLAVMLYGQDLGLSIMQAIQGIDVVEGKPRISAKLMVAKARQAGHRVSQERTESSCTVEVVRADTGERHSVTFTTQDAVTAGLCVLKDGKVMARSQRGKPMPWETRHRTMLQWRAAQECLDFICPEITFGFQLRADDAQVDADGLEVDYEAEAGDFDEEIQDAEVVDPDDAAAEIAKLASQFNFENAQQREPQSEPVAADVPDEPEHGDPLHYSPDEIAEGS